MLTKTLKIQIFPSDNQIVKFRVLQRSYIDACNDVSNWIFNHDFELSQRSVNDAMYYVLRERYGMLAQITQSVIRTVIARYKSVCLQMKQKIYKYHDIYTGEVYKYKRVLQWLQKPVTFKRPVATLLRNRDYSLTSGMYSISTNDGREKVPFTEPDVDYYTKYSDWTFGAANLVERRGKWYLYISVSKEFDEMKLEDVQHVVGIDRGLRQIITTYDEQSKVSFISGKDIMQKRRHYKKLRTELQRKGTKSAKKRMKALGQKENRWMNDVNHRITKALIDQYGPNTLFVIEDLENVTFDTVNNRKKDDRYEHHSWAFYQLEEQLMYKAVEHNSLVLKVSAKYTSQRCPKCGSIHKENRDKMNHLFTCIQCGYRSNDDRVAAMNIQELGRIYMSGIDKPQYEKMVPKLLY